MARIRHSPKSTLMSQMLLSAKPNLFHFARTANITTSTGLIADLRDHTRFLHFQPRYDTYTTITVAPLAISRPNEQALQHDPGSPTFTLRYTC